MLSVLKDSFFFHYNPSVKPSVCQLPLLHTEPFFAVFAGIVGFQKGTALLFDVPEGHKEALGLGKRNGVWQNK